MPRTKNQQPAQRGDLPGQLRFGFLAESSDDESDRPAESPTRRIHPTRFVKRGRRRSAAPGQLEFRFPEGGSPGPPCLRCAGPTRVVESVGIDRRSRVECLDPGCATWRFATPVKQHWRRIKTS
jgi:hypothetical protein